MIALAFCSLSYEINFNKVTYKGSRTSESLKSFFQKSLQQKLFTFRILLLSLTIPERYIIFSYFCQATFFKSLLVANTRCLVHTSPNKYSTSPGGHASSETTGEKTSIPLSSQNSNSWCEIHMRSFFSLSKYWRSFVEFLTLHLSNPSSWSFPECSPINKRNETKMSNTAHSSPPVTQQG